MSCPACRSLGPPGARRCAVCGSELERPSRQRKVSLYDGVHSLTHQDGRPIRSLIDLGPSPWPNLLVGACVCLAFAASAVPAIVANAAREPAAITGARPTMRDEGLFVLFTVRDCEGRSLATEGTLEVQFAFGSIGAKSGALTGPLTTAAATRTVRPEDFRTRTTRYLDKDERLTYSRELVAEVGPFVLEDLRTVASLTDEVGVQVGLRLTTASGTTMQATSPWFVIGSP